jgi:hypothetical protein
METPMYRTSLLFVDPPALSDEAADQMLDFLYDLIAAYENHYTKQLHQPPLDPPEPPEYLGDEIEFDDEIPF